MRPSQNVDVLVSNRYDHLGRRVQKITPEATHTYFYDGWMLVKEVVERSGDPRRCGVSPRQYGGAGSSTSSYGRGRGWKPRLHVARRFPNFPVPKIGTPMEIVKGMDGFMRVQMGSDLSTSDGVTPAVETSGASGDVKLVVPKSGKSCFYKVVRK